ncbi:DUF952 domain-containing protein [Luedemannella helvata]|uniref:DUF952 domain-containing protein n=1 Tax=Luedemannella helvata TaxID=349315 RepID=A0ABP4X1B9_9ACTN
MIYKLLTSPEWAQAVESGQFDGSVVDHQDGYIHFSTAEQVVVTAQRYFTGVPDLTMLVVDPTPLGDALRWEPSRGGDLFPHLYAPLPVSAVTAVIPLPDNLPAAEAVATAMSL